MANIAGQLIKIFGGWFELCYWPTIIVGMGSDGKPYPIAVNSDGTASGGSSTGANGGLVIADTSAHAGPYNILKAGNGADVVIATVTLPANWGGGTLTNWTISNGDTLIIPGMTALTLTSGSCLAYK